MYGLFRLWLQFLSWWAVVFDGVDTGNCKGKFLAFPLSEIALSLHKTQPVCTLPRRVWAVNRMGKKSCLRTSLLRFWRTRDWCERRLASSCTFLPFYLSFSIPLRFFFSLSHLFLFLFLYLLAPNLSLLCFSAISSLLSHFTFLGL